MAVYALALPEFGKAFVSDTFSLEGVSRGERGGFRGGVDLGNLVAVLRRSSHAEKHADPFSILTAATGGTQLHFRKQKELEDAIATIGVELRSAYLLSYYADSTESGYHTVTIEVDMPGAKALAWWSVRETSPAATVCRAAPSACASPIAPSIPIFSWISSGAPL